MAIVRQFPAKKATPPGRRPRHDLDTVIILPVVRIERHPDDAAEVQPGRQRRPRMAPGEVLRKVRQLQEEMKRPRS